MSSANDRGIAGYPREMTINRLFEAQAASSPGRVALRSGGEEMTYGRLDARANHFSRQLHRSGVGRGTLVGLCLERSTDLIVALLAILKAGGAYVPLDPELPDERLSLMIRDASLSVIVAHPGTSRRLDGLLRPGLLRMDYLDGSPDGEEGAGPDPGVGADDLAYVMYTSGSTGSPKGVMVGHRAVVRLVRGTDYCDFGDDQVFLQLAPTSFDASTFEIWGPLLNGASLALMAPGTPTLDELEASIRRHGVTTLWLTSGLFNLVVDRRPRALAGLRQLLAGGDRLSPSHVVKALAAMPEGTLINGYGPTEATTFSCCYRMSGGYRPSGSIPIGRAIAHTTAYVLDESLRRVPDGQPGELCIGGDGLAHGYLNDPGLTSRKFVPDPFGNVRGGRLYRTGDLARVGADGEIEFLGRDDGQVKVSGHRIELDEVEAALQKHPALARAAVVARAALGGDKRLDAYVVARDGRGLDLGGLRAFLAGSLPAYMIPSTFAEVAEIPLSINGKVDRSALPDPFLARPEALTTASGGPRLLGEVARLWCQILGRDVGLDDNFFESGGRSLQLIELHARLRDLVPGALAITDLFENPTVRSLAERLGGRVDRERHFSPEMERARKQKEAMARSRMRRTPG